MRRGLWILSGFCALAGALEVTNVAMMAHVMHFRTEWPGQSGLSSDESPSDLSISHALHPCRPYAPPCPPSSFLHLYSLSKVA